MADRLRRSMQVSLGPRANLWQFWIEIIAGYKEKRHSGGDKVRDSAVAFSGHGALIVRRQVLEWTTPISERWHS